MKKKREPGRAAAPGADKHRRGEIIEIGVTDLTEEGYGAGRLEEHVVVVRGGLPGEQVRARISHAGRRTIVADVVKVLRHAPQRAASPPCPHAGSCEGCPLIIMQYRAQLAWKKSMVEGELRRYPVLREVPVQDPLPSPRQLHYRNSAKLVVAGKFAAPIIGIYGRNTHDVLDIGDCPLHHPLINRVAQAVKEGIRKGKVPIYNPRTANGILRYLVVRVAEETNQAMVVLVTAQRSFNEIHHLGKYLQSAVPEVTVVAQNVNPSAGNVILGQHDHFLTKERQLTAKVGDVLFAISPRSFFQVNSGGAEIIYDKVREWSELTGKERVVDLYCGIGGIALFLAPRAREVLGIEVVDAAVEDARRNAQLNRRQNCSFEAGDAAEILEELREEGEKFDLVVMNPPRKGCDEEVLQAVAHLGPQRIIYVSCSPRTLARDLEILSRSGYATREVQPVDMFPQTPHVENVAILVKAGQTANDRGLKAKG